MFPEKESIQLTHWKWLRCSTWIKQVSRRMHLLYFYPVSIPGKFTFCCRCFSNLVVRQDASEHLSRFVLKASSSISGETVFYVRDPRLATEHVWRIQAMGVLKVLSDLMKTAPLERIEPEMRRIRTIISDIRASEHLSSDTIIRRYNIKVSSRAIIRTFPEKRPSLWKRGADLENISFTYSQYPTQYCIYSAGAGPPHWEYRIWECWCFRGCRICHSGATRIVTR